MPRPELCLNISGVVSKSRYAEAVSKRKHSYDIPPSAIWRTWNRRNNSKNNSLLALWWSSMTFSSFVAFGQWSCVFAAIYIFETASAKIHYPNSTEQGV